MTKAKSPRTVEYPFSDDALQALDRFIHQPESREQDVFLSETYEVGDTRVLEWVIRHDIFEGVLSNLNLVDQEAYRHLEGTTSPIERAEDAIQTFSLTYDGKTYALKVQKA